MGLTYNSKNENIFDITNEKTDHSTNNKTDYDTNPDTVTRTFQEWHKLDGRTVHGKTIPNSCAIRFFGCRRHHRGWVTFTLPDEDQIKRNKEMNEDNDK